jgi:hypothetical protein
MLCDPCEAEFERRLADRSSCSRGALLRIHGLNDLFSFTIRDISTRGMAFRLHGKQPLLPVEFVITEDGCHTFRRCRLVWREAEFGGAKFIWHSC